MLESWLVSGAAGEMTYMHRNQNVRSDPRLLLDGAKTIISLAAGYYFDQPVLQPDNPRISRYALGNDYHMVLRKRGLELLDFIDHEFGPVRGRFFTDSAPIFEKAWARKAGLGWIGKNGCLITPRTGSWFFLAELIVDLELECDLPPVADRCGTCTRCVEACPTGALPGDGSVRATRCISYLTIEHKSAFDSLTGEWSDWIFGCDICQEVCPWNRKAPVSTIHEFSPLTGRISLSASDYLQMSEEQFKEMFAGSPLERTGLNRIRRNVIHVYKTGRHEQDI